MQSFHAECAREQGLDMGPVPVNPTTVIALQDGMAEVVREGAGPVPGAALR